MQFFRVYKHKTKGYYAVPVGFNIQAAIFSFLWAAANNLWSKAILLFIFLMAMLGIIMYGMTSQLQILIYAGIAGLSILPIWSGVSGNSWIFEYLENQGYSLVRKIRATNANAAISQTKKMGKRSNSSNAHRKNRNAQTNDEDLPINAEPEWRRRRNNRMIK